MVRAIKPTQLDEFDVRVLSPPDLSILFSRHTHAHDAGVGFFWGLDPNESSYTGNNSLTSQSKTLAKLTLAYV